MANIIQKRRRAAAVVILDEVYGDLNQHTTPDNFGFRCGAVLAALSHERKAKRKRHRCWGGFNITRTYNIDEFRTFFRVSKTTLESLHEYIIRVARENNVNGIVDREFTGGVPQKPLRDRLQLLLWYLSTQDRFSSMAYRFGMSESTANTAIHDLMKFIGEYVVKEVIVWPNEEEKHESKDMFYQVKGFPGVIGMIDGTHIEIEKPSERGYDYYNRKDYYSVVLQAVVYEDMRFTDVYAGWPGKVHDAHVFRRSPLNETGQQMCGADHILGDSAYPNLPWLLVPFRDNGHLTPVQNNYNKVHAGIRSTVERAFGMLKGRFTRLKYVAQKKTSTIVYTILSACVLHNLCIFNDDMIQDYLVEQQGPQKPLANIQDYDANAVEDAAHKRLSIARILP